VNDLIEFLRARIDEDAEVAASADDGPWWVEDTSPRHWGEERDAEVACSQGKVAMLGYDRSGGVNAEHIARHDPARVLREVEAKRRVLDRHHAGVRYEHDRHVRQCIGCGTEGEFDDPVTEDINDCPELRDMASIYADHPDYRPEWAPTT
jgi:hypothetical protein